MSRQEEGQGVDWLKVALDREAYAAYDDDNRGTLGLWDHADDDGEPGIDEDQAAAWTEVGQLDREIAALADRLEARPRAQAGAVTFDPDQDQLDELSTRLAELLETWGRPPADWQPEPSRHAAARSPSFPDILAERLSPGQLAHWRWITEGRTQDAIAAELGISQPAVVKRERKVRALVDALYRETYGKPYPFLGAPDKRRRPHVRGRRL